MKSCGCSDSTLPNTGQAFPANVTDVCKLSNANQGMICFITCIHLFMLLTSLEIIELGNMKHFKVSNIEVTLQNTT